MIKITNNSFVYTPVADFIGNDSFLYQIIDSSNNKISATATVSVVASTAGNNTPATQSGGGSSGGLFNPGALIVFLFIMLYNVLLLNQVFRFCQMHTSNALQYC